MYPDLSYIFHDLLGTAPDNWLSVFKTFGFFLAIAFLASAIVFSIELRRKAREGVYTPKTVQVTIGAPASVNELVANAVVGLLLAGKLYYAYQNFADFKRDPASIVLSLKMSWIPGIIGAVALTGLTWWDANRRKKDPPEVRNLLVYPHNQISEMTVWAAIGGILGSKIFDIFDNWDSFIQSPIETLTSPGGLAFFGGLILGFITVVSYIYRQKIPFLPTADAVAPALVWGYGVGRVGCQLAGDGDWGIVNNAPKPGWMSMLPDWMWAFRYPHNVLRSEPPNSVSIPDCNWYYRYQLSEPVFPTPFYESLMMIVVFLILWSIRKRIKIPGLIFFIYLALISIERFIIEKIRVNVTHNVLGITLTQAEIISIILFSISIAGGIFVWRRYESSKNIATPEAE